jgi:BirA family biotin operon repressor/biotin-[acetyl-CoA-carboxylase] ligase
MSSTSQTAQPVDDRFAPGDFTRIVSDTLIDRVDYHDEIESTNSRATQLDAESPDDRSCVLVLTENQTAGRGRGANRWWSTSGALTFSVLYRPNAVDLPANRWPQLSLTAGLAVCEAIESLLSDVTLGIKWPNDVYLNGRKVCGILVEAATGGRGSVVGSSIVLGIGVNVHNSVENAPHDLRDKVIALSDVVAGTIRRVDVLVAILQQLATRLDWLGADVAGLQEAWCRRCLLTGRSVEIELPSRRLIGLCRGIDHDGALIVETEAGRERCLSGVVVRFD